MKVAVIGGGLGGTTAAMALARRGIETHLYEARDLPMDGASRWNEGKLHLGYVFAKDRSLATARVMMEGSCTFFPILREFYGAEVPTRHSPSFVYDVVTSGQLSPDAVLSQFAAIDRLLDEERALCGGYPVPVVPYTQFASPGGRTSAKIQVSLRTTEIAIDISSLADFIRERVGRTGGPLRVFANRAVEAVTRQDNGHYALSAGGELPGDTYTHVINASWQNRLALDRSAAHRLPGDWSHRFKIAIHFRDLPSAESFVPSTGILGEYGDIVGFPDGSLYLSWYPASRLMFSREILPPVVTEPTAAEARQLFDRVIDGAATLWPAVEGLRRYREQATIRGGYIYNRGDTDIDDPASGLHRRCQFGISASGNYVSLDSGKLCTAPLVGLLAAAQVTADWQAPPEIGLDLAHCYHLGAPLPTGEPEQLSYTGAA